MEKSRFCACKLPSAVKITVHGLPALGGTAAVNHWVGCLVPLHPFEIAVSQDVLLALRLENLQKVMLPRKKDQKIRVQGKSA